MMLAVPFWRAALMANRWSPYIEYAPQIDQPIITSGTGNGSGSFATQTVHNFKRIDDNVANGVDVDNDPKFRYPGVPAGTLLTGTTTATLRGIYMPGGAASFRRWETQIETVTESKYILYTWVPTKTAPRILVSVNGKWISPSFTVTGAAGGSSFVLFEFQDRRSREVKFVTFGENQMGNVQTESAYPPVRAASAGSLLLVIGDSMSAGAGEPPGYASALDTWAHPMAPILGFDHVCNCSIGGTKWVASGSGDVAVSHFGGGRLPLALTLSPAAVVFCGSRNDAGSTQANLDAITSAVTTALAATTAPKIFVMGRFTPGPQDAAVAAGAAAASVPYIDMTDALTTGDLGVDGVHPTYAGAFGPRTKAAIRLRRAGCRP